MKGKLKTMAVLGMAAIMAIGGTVTVKAEKTGMKVALTI